MFGGFGVTTRISWGILHLEVHLYPCLSEFDTSANEGPTRSSALLRFSTSHPNHLTHPAPAKPQSVLTEPRCSSILRRSRQFHSAVHRWLTVCITSRHLWMSVDVSNQGATGQQQTSVTQCFPGAVSLLPKHGSRRQPSDGRAGTDMKKNRTVCAILNLIHIYGSRMRFSHM